MPSIPRNQLNKKKAKVAPARHVCTRPASWRHAQAHEAEHGEETLQGQRRPEYQEQKRERSQPAYAEQEYYQPFMPDVDEVVQANSRVLWIRNPNILRDRHAASWRIPLQSLRVAF